MKSNFAFRIDGDIREALEKEASAEDRSMAYLINRHLREGLEKAGYLKPEKKTK